jgi:hypothetical protein
MTAHVAKPPMKSAVLFGWEDRNELVPVYFKTNASFHAHRFSFASTNKILQKIRRHLAFEINWN